MIPAEASWTRRFGWMKACPGCGSVEAEALQRVDEDVGGDLHVAPVGGDRDVAHGADGHAAPLDR